MKTKMKNRLISALLALTMVASLLPAGLIIPAKAASPLSGNLGTTIGDISLTFDPDGTYHVRLNSSATGSYNIAFAIVPAFNPDSTRVVQDAIADGRLGIRNTDYLGLGGGAASRYIPADAPGVSGEKRATQQLVRGQVKEWTGKLPGTDPLAQLGTNYPASKTVSGVQPTGGVYTYILLFVTGSTNLQWTSGTIQDQKPPLLEADPDGFTLTRNDSAVAKVSTWTGYQEITLTNTSTMTTGGSLTVTNIKTIPATAQAQNMGATITKDGTTSPRGSMHGNTANSNAGTNVNITFGPGETAKLNMALYNTALQTGTTDTAVAANVIATSGSFEITYTYETSNGTETKKLTIPFSLERNIAKLVGDTIVINTTVSRLKAGVADSGTITITPDPSSASLYSRNHTLAAAPGTPTQATLNTSFMYYTAAANITVSGVTPHNAAANSDQNDTSLVPSGGYTLTLSTKTAADPKVGTYYGVLTAQYSTAKTFKSTTMGQILIPVEIHVSDPKESFKVTFHYEDGVTADYLAATNEANKVEATDWPDDPTRTDYTFKGWYDGQNGAGTKYTGSEVFGANKDLYAYWEPDTTDYVVSFNAGSGGTLSKTSWTGTDPTADIGWPITTPGTNKLFKEWNTKADGTGTTIATTNKTWNALAGISGIDKNDSTHTITVYAQWVDQYTITFNSNGGTPTTPQTKLTGVDGKILSAPTSPTRTSYTFLGWFDTKDHADAATSTSSTGYVADVANVVHNASSTKIYYAAWTQNTYTATVNVEKDGAAYSPSDKVFLKKSGTVVNTGGTSISSGAAAITGVPDGTYDIFIGNTDTKVDITINGANNSATVNYYTVTAAKGANAATATVNGGASAVVLSGTDVTLAATPIAAYTGDTASWTMETPSGGSGSLSATSASGNSVTYTVNGTTKATAKYTTEATYTATITLWENASGGSNAKVAATAVALGNAVNGSDATGMTTANAASGVWTKANVTSSTSYKYVTITVDGATYTIPLDADIAYSTNESEDVVLFKITLEVDTTASGSAAPYGAATVTAGGHDFTATSSTSTPKGTVTFHAPGIDNAVTLKSADPKVDATLTPAVNYTDSVTGNANWTVVGHNGVTTDGQAFKPAAATTITAKFTPHGILKFNKAFTAEVEKGYSDTIVWVASGAGSKESGKGYVENIGPANATGLTYTFVDTAGTTGAAAKLTMDTEPTAVNANAWAPASIKLLNGLPQGTYKVNLTVASSDDNDALTDTVEITIKVLPPASATASPNSLTWDTYTKTIHGNPHTATTWDTKIQLKNLQSIEDVTFGGNSLVKDTDYKITSTTPTAVSGDSTGKKELPLQLTKAGLEKVAAGIVAAGASSGTISVVAKDTTGALKTASITMTLEDTMPKLASATFKNGTGVTTDSGVKYWAKGSAGEPDLEILTNTTEAKTDTALDTGAVTYKWYKNGMEQSGWTASNLTLTQWNSFAIGDVIRVEATGQGAAWSAKPSGKHAYKDTVTVADTIKIGMPKVTVKISVDGGTQQDPPYQGITAKADPSTTNTLLTTTNPDTKKYVFVNWHLATSGGGAFGVASPTTDDQTDPTVIFTPATAATVVANYKTIATLEYTKGATATGPNSASDNTKYTDTLKNVGAKAATITSVAIDSASATYFNIVDTAAKAAPVAANGTSGAFTITPNSGTPAGNYFITVTTTYTYKDGGTNTDITATVVQTVKYTVPAPNYTVTLTEAAGGVISGTATDTGNNSATKTVPTSGTGNDTVASPAPTQALSVAEGTMVSLTATPKTGWKFVEWSRTDKTIPTTATKDKFMGTTTNTSNNYGPVTENATLTAEFKKVTDLSESHTKDSETTNIGYTTTQTVYSGKVDNAGALAASGTRFELKNQKKNGTTVGDYFTLAAPILASGAATVPARNGATVGTLTTTVNAKPSLGAGVYTADLVITEVTDDDNTMSGTHFERTIKITFTVGATLNVKLNSDFQNTENVVLVPTVDTTNHSSITATKPTGSSNDYLVTGMVDGETYNIYVNSKNTKVTLASTATAAKEVQFWTLTTDTAGSGTVAVKDGDNAVKVTLAGGEGYLNGSKITSITAAPAPGSAFKQWSDERTNKNMGWDSNTPANTLSGADNIQFTTLGGGGEIVMDADRHIKATFVTKLGIKYHYNDSASTVFDTGIVYVTGDTVNLLPAVYRDGYIFKGWYGLAADGTTHTTTMAGGSSQTAGTVATLGVIIDNYHNLYAEWEAEPKAPTWPNLRDGQYGKDYSASAAITNASDIGTSGTVTYSATGLPGGLTMANTGMITGKPYHTGDFSVTVTATDGTTSWTHTCTIHVNKATPSITGLTFAGAVEGAAASAITPYGTVTAPYWTGSAWVDAKNYVYSSSATPSPNPGALAVTSPDPLNFGTDLSKSGTVKFTPSTSVNTGIKTVTGGSTDQKFDDIYNAVTVPCTFHKGGQTYGIKVDPTNGNTSVDIGTALGSTEWEFDVINLGNQDAHVTYTLMNAADHAKFDLTPSYTHKGDTADTSTGNNDKIAADTSGSGVTAADAFKVTPKTSGSDAIDVSVTGVYTVYVLAENHKLKADGTLGDVESSVVVPIRLEIKAKDFEGKIQIDLWDVGNTTSTPSTANAQEPRGGSVMFQEWDATANSGAGGVKAGSTPIVATWDGTDKVYKANLSGTKTYVAVVNGFVTGETVTYDTAPDTAPDTTLAVVDLYQVVLDQDAGSKTSKDITSSGSDSQTGPKYLANGEEGHISTPANFANDAGTEIWDFDTTSGKGWHNGTSTVATSSGADYTGTGAAVTLTANYKKRDSNTAKIEYYKNVTSGDLLWDKTVAKDVETDVSSTVPTRTGWYFKSWNTASDGSGKTFAKDGKITPVAAFSSPEGATEAVFDANGVVKLYAQWGRISQTGDGFSTKTFETYYSDRFSESVAVNGWQDEDGAAAAAPAVKYTYTGTLPAGLTLDPITGVISGRPYVVDTTGTAITVSVVPADDPTGVSLITPISVTIKVDKYQPRLSNIIGSNAGSDKLYTTADYEADVIANILKYKKGENAPDAAVADKDASGKALRDIWADDATIVDPVQYGGSGGSVTTTTAANGGTLSVDDTTSKFAPAVNNAVDLTWTPDASAGAFPLTDGHSQSFEDIYKVAHGKANVTTDGKTWGMELSKTLIKFKTVKDSGVWYQADGTTALTDAYRTFTATSKGNQDIYVTWAIVAGADAAKFALEPTTPSNRVKLDKDGGTTTTQAIKATNGTTPPYDDVVGSYTAQVKVDYYEAADSVTPKGSEYVTLVLEVVEPTTFDFEVDTYLKAFNASGDETLALGDLVSATDLTAVKLLAVGATDSGSGLPYIAPTRPASSATGKYLFNGLDATKTYEVYVNGYKVPGVTINKTSGTQRVELYELEVGQDGNGTADPTVTPPTAATGLSVINDDYFMAGQNIGVDAAAGASGYIFQDWNHYSEDSAVATSKPDTKTEHYSAVDPMTYTMSAQAVKLEATYKNGVKFRVELNGNGGSLGYASGEDYYDVITGGAKGGTSPNFYYEVDDGKTFGLGAAAATASAGRYTATRIGHAFKGWGLASNTTVANAAYSFTANQTAADTVTTDGDKTITLYAVWEEAQLELTDATITGTYKHDIVPTGGAVTGGTPTYTFSAPTAGDFPALGLGLDTATGQVGTAAAKTPTDTGTKAVTVQVTDATGATDTATYTIIIGKADVTPSTRTGEGLPTATPTIPAGTTDPTQAVLDLFDNTVMDGDGTSETVINGTWTLGGKVPTEPGTYTVTATFTPENADTVTTDPRTKDGNHYNPYTYTLTVTVAEPKKITNADLDNGTTKVMTPVVGSALKALTDIQGATNSLDDSDATDDPNYTDDVEITSVAWYPADANAAGGQDYTLYVTLEIRDGSDWIFDTTGFGDSTISGKKASVVGKVSEKLVTLKVVFPKRIALVDVSTTVPKVGDTATSVTIPALHFNEYEFAPDAKLPDGAKWQYRWIKLDKGDSYAPTATVVGGSVTFEKDEYYALEVHLTPKNSMEFAKLLTDAAAGAELKDGSDWLATVNTAVPPAGNQKAVTAVAYDATNKVLTIRYDAFTPTDKDVVALKISGQIGVYYAQTGDSKNHFQLSDKTASSPVIGAVGSADKITFTFAWDKDTTTPALTVVPVNREVNPTNGTVSRVDGAPLTLGTTTGHFEIGKLDGSNFTPLPASFKDGYASETDVAKWDNAKLVVRYVGTDITADVPGVLRVRQLRADTITATNTTGNLPETRYEAGEKFDIGTGALTATVAFNTKADETGYQETAQGTNPVANMTYAQYNANTSAGSKTYFLEAGPANAPTFVAHGAADGTTGVFALGANALLTELVDGTTVMSSLTDGYNTIYMTYIDANHNLVRTAIGTLDQGSDFGTRIDDPNGDPAEYGDKLQGTPLKPNPAFDPDQPESDANPKYKDPVTNPGDYTYEWQIWVPGPNGDTDPTNPDATDPGSWKPIPNDPSNPSGPKETERTHTPGPDEVGEYIRVVATDPTTKTDQPSAPELIYARSLNFDVKAWNKKVDTTATNVHKYTSDDFTLKAIGTTNGLTVGGVMPGDTVTLAPKADWNDTAASRPPYLDTDSDSDATDVGSAITWPAITDSTDATADKTGGYDLNCKVNAKNKPVYRLRPQDALPDKGVIYDGDVTIEDENKHDAEYGDKLTAKPGDNVPPDPTDPSKPKNTYTWEKWVPIDPDDPGVGDPTKGEWKPIPGGTGKDYYPGPDDVGEDIRVVITTPGGDDYPSDSKHIEPRSLNFIVEPQNKDYDGDAENEHTYLQKDFSPTRVEKDYDATNGFTAASPVYGGVYGSDVVKIKPSTGNVWNDTDAHRPPYAAADINSEITWPNVLTGAGKGSAELSGYALDGTLADTTLTGSGVELKNSKGVVVYRLVPQDKQEHRGKILGGGGGVIHVDVSFKYQPAIGAAIPDHPMGVTDVRETKPGEASATKAGDEWVASEFTSTWYEVDGTTPPTDFATATAGGAMTSGDAFQSGNYYTVVVKVNPETGYFYGDDTRFYYHFGEALHVKVKDTPTGILGGYIAPTDDEPYWTMWYTFDPDSMVLPPFPGDTPLPAVDAGNFRYYANTATATTTGGTTTYANDHHYTEATADNAPIPGGAASVPFQFNLKAFKDAIDAGGAGTTRKRSDGTEFTLTAANYGTAWRVVAGDRPENATLALDDNTSGAYVGRTFRDTVKLPTNPNEGDSDRDAAGYDNKLVYVQIILADGTTQIYPQPFGVTSGDSVEAKPLTVRELEATEIAATGNPTLRYIEGDTFDASGVTKATVTFATPSGTDLTYDKAARGDAADTKGEKYYFQYLDNGTYTGLKHGDSLSKTTHDTKPLYICYTDVNNHIVRKLLGVLSVGGTLTSTAAVYIRNTSDADDDTRYGDVIEAVVVGTTDATEVKWQRLMDHDNDPDTAKEWVDVGDATQTKLYLADKADVGTQIRAVLVKDGSITTNFESNTLTVGKKELTVSFTASDKEWDGTDTATIVGSVTISGAVVVDATLAATLANAGEINDDIDLDTNKGDMAKFDNANVGKDKTVTLWSSNDTAADTVFAIGDLTGTETVADPDVTFTVGDCYELDPDPVTTLADITARRLSWSDFTFTGKVKRYDGTKTVYKNDNFSLTDENTVNNPATTDAYTGDVAAADGLWSLDATKITDATLRAALEAKIKATDVEYTTANSLEVREKPITAATKADGHSVITLTLGAVTANDPAIILPTGNYYIKNSAINPKQVTVGATAGVLDAISFPYGATETTVHGKVNGGVGGTEQRVPADVTANKDITFDVQATVAAHTEADTEANVTFIGVRQGESAGIYWEDSNYKLVWDDSTGSKGTIEKGTPIAIEITDPTVTYGDALASTKLSVKITLLQEDGTTTQTTKEYTFADLAAMKIAAIVEHDTDSDGSTMEYEKIATATKAGWDKNTNPTASLNVHFYYDADGSLAGSKASYDNTNAPVATDTDPYAGGKTYLGAGKITVEPYQLTVTPTWSLDVANNGTTDTDGDKGKFYDGTKNALTGIKDATGAITDADITATMTFDLGTLPFAGDKVSVNTGYTAEFGDKNVGTDKPIDVALAATPFTGDHSNRYGVKEVKKANGDIVKRPVTLVMDKPSVPQNASVNTALRQSFTDTTTGIMANDTINVGVSVTYLAKNGIATGETATAWDETTNNFNKTDLVGVFTKNVTWANEVYSGADDNYDITVTVPGGDVTKLNDVPVKELFIDYYMPKKTEKPRDAQRYGDSTRVSVAAHVAGDDTTTQWYKDVADKDDFTNTAAMDFAADEFAAKGYYMAQSVFTALPGNSLSDKTKVWIDRTLWVTADGDVEYVSGDPDSGLLSAKAIYADGKITVQAIYRVPDDVLNNISITHPEPVKGKEPLPKRDNTKRTYEYLSAHAKVSDTLDATTSAPTNDTLGSRWYDVGANAPTAANKTTVFDPSNAANAYLTGNFGSGRYYMVEGIITAETGYVFASKELYVTINGIVVEVADSLADAVMKAKYDDAGNEIGWAVAVRDGAAIKARYIARTEPDKTTNIYRVAGYVTTPIVGMPITNARITDKAAWFITDEPTDNVEFKNLHWEKSTVADFSSNVTSAGSTFEAGYYYRATFQATPKSGYNFTKKDGVSNFVAFRFNDVDKGSEWGINGQTKNDSAEKNGITVTSKENSANDYTITVRFPMIGEKKDLEVRGYVVAPTAGAAINASAITLKTPESYEAKNGADKEATKWQHWNSAANKWEDASGTFQRGEYYRALITAKLKNDPHIRNLYNDFTPSTKGFIDDVEVNEAALPANAPSRNGLRASKTYKIAGDTTVTLMKEFRVDRAPVTVHISSKVPTAGAYSVDMDVKFYTPDNGLYTLSDGDNASIVGQWYNDAAGTTPATVFEENKTYYLITTATAAAGNYFIDAKEGYQWVENDDASGRTKQYEKLTVTDGDIVKAKAIFAYTIPLTPTAKVDIPGFADAPRKNVTLGNIWTDDGNFEAISKKWTLTEDGEALPDGTTAEPSTTYYATIEVVAKPGVQVTGDCFFNGHGTDDTNFVFHEIVGKTEDGRDIYRLIYKFPPTDSQSSGGGGGGGGGGTVESPVVYYHLKDQGVTDDPTAEKVRKNSKPTKVPKVKPMTGLKFLGWSEVDPSTLPAGKLPTLVDPTTFKITADKWFYAVYEQGTEVDHNHYVIGFPNGTFGPDAKITRAEVATIIARSCLEGFVEGANYGNPGNYSDVTTHWAFSAIAFCAREGVFKGYEDGTFRPDRYITRQELATVVARLAGIQTSQGVPFNDKDQIASWAMNGVYTAYANGWIKGYEDGTFQPERDISRAETVKIFNGYLKRGVDAKGLEGLKEYVHTGVASNNTQDNHDEYMTWPDVPKTHWAYHEIIEAANDHNYHWQDAEKKTPPEDWDEVYIDKKWKYNDNLNDGADKRDENISAQKTFTITYLVSSNGVTYDAITETVERFASPKPENMPIAVPNEGYRFAGWSSTDPSTGTITLVDPTASGVTADKWFYAVFEEDKPSTLPVYTVTYVIGELGSYDGATVERVEMFQAPSVAGLPQPTVSEGYRLAGWSETDPAAGSYTIVDPTANYVTGDKTFYAVYEKADEPYHLPVYTVTYVIGENGSYSGATVEQVEMFQAPSVTGLPQPVANEGYRFVGWSETDPANGGYSIMDPTANYVTGDKTFYAVYEAL